MQNSDSIRQEIIQLATQAKVDEVRFIDAGPFEAESAFAGRQSRDFLKTANTVIIFGTYIGGYALDGWKTGTHGKTSRLVLSGFYFDVVEPIRPILDYLHAKGHQAVLCDGFDESNCIPLKPAALRGGLGWVGKNSLLLNPKYGSWQALGAIITDANLALPYQQMEDRCGTCQACIKACPTGAIETPHCLTQEKCLSYLLEEPDLPEEFVEKNQGYFLECDICQLACPWNQKHLENPLDTPRGMEFDKSNLDKLLRIDYLASMDEKTYCSEILPFLSGITLTYENFMRNIGFLSKEW